MSSDYLYFILTETPERPRHISPGRICFISGFNFRSKLRDSPTKLPVVFMDTRTSLSYEIEMSCMTELSADEAELLQALSGDAERLRWFRDEAALHTAVGLTVGSPVTVEEGAQLLRGIIRYIGRLTRPNYPEPITGRFFGIELQGDDKGKGNTDGTLNYETFFTCKKDCGIFVPFSRVRPVVPISPSPPAQPEREELLPGDRVTYFIKNYYRLGMVVDVKEKGGEQLVRISTDTDENGKTGGEVEISIQCVVKGEVPTEADSTDVNTSPLEPNAGDLGLSVNSMVELALASGNSYGIIRWIGMLPGRQETMAGLELEDEKGVSDGTFKNERFFECPPKRALFVKLSSCRPDSRFQYLSASHSEMMSKHEDPEGDSGHSAVTLDAFPPVSTEQIQVLVGRMKGIQGHCNSCYMDAALFSLFSCSSALDSMLFKTTEPQDAPIQHTLLHDIVNPLRSKGFVEARHIMKLRQQLQNHGYSRSFTTDEKDPEEFLIVIMHHILALEPLLKLSAGGKVQESYCYQIFLDQNHSLVLPTVQQLLEHSFHSAGLKLAEVPSCLMLQMPRFGKKFKMFDKIIPSLELDITDLLSEGPQQCMLCGNLAQEECTDCFKDTAFSQTGFKIFCKTCSAQVHAHPQRRFHQPAPLDIPAGYLSRGSPHTLTRDKLELFAVLCIETSHYVSFIKYGPNSQDWLFFDSMADRQGEIDGFNIPEVHTCPEVGMYLEMSPAELANQVPRDMKGVAKRLFCDAYMYLYQSSSMCLYR
ncbi:hypothetical protein PAMP_023995 [Pampus punctatissimus]